ncbi:MAG: HlyC/CorC family transporter [Gammaproteobacteria bacterium]|nr:HlyC/CorC family transporter [Gammaproteobacteria bacterium]
MTNLFFILAAVALVLMNAFFVAAEFGMVKLRHTRVAAIKRLYGVRGRVLFYVHQHLDAYLSACQLGITLASIGLGWVGEPAFARAFTPLFGLIGLKNPEFVKLGAFFLAFTFISFLHIVIGELMPKSLAIRQSEKVSLWTALPLYAFYWIMYPAIWVLNNCANFLLRLTGFNTVQRGEYFYSTDEIKLILSTSHLHGELSKDETEILEHTLEFAELKVTEVMRPQEEMIMLSTDQTLDEMFKIASQHRYSRYPVFDHRKQKIIGIVHVKDFFAALYDGKKITNLKPFLRPVLKVSQRLPALDLLRKFREGMPHFALVYKNRETLLGFVTLDNLLHILIGRIKDEFHRTQDDWILNPDGSLTVRGDSPLSSLERALGIEIDLSAHDPAPETLTGLILNHLGRLPAEKEKIDFKKFRVIILKVKGSHIIKAKIIPKKSVEPKTTFDVF